MSYVLGIKDTGNAKAEQGSIVHKALELLACKKLATQNGESSFFNDELNQTFDTQSFTPDQAADAAIQHYVPKSIHVYGPEELKLVRKLMFDALAFNDGQFSPLNRTILWPEKYFDFPIEADWAKYRFTDPHTGKLIEGQLSVKGTMDLTCYVEGFDNWIELVDYKTGSRRDWNDNRRWDAPKKDIKKLRNDPQLRLYHYALSRLCPWAEHIVVTIMYIKDGGVFTLPPFTKDDLPKTEKMLRDRFEAIKDNLRPKLNKTWKCTSFCWFGKNNFEGTDTTVCEHLSNELVTLGMDKCIKKHGKPGAFVAYGDGGGMSNRDERRAA